MAIKNSSGEKCTPKQLAKELVSAAVKAARVDDASDMTEKELALVNEQLAKVSGRVLKVLGTDAE